MRDVLGFHMKPVDIIEPAVPRFGHDRQTPPVTGRVRRTVLNPPRDRRIAGHADTVRVCDHDRPFEKTAFFHPGGAGHFAIAI